MSGATIIRVLVLSDGERLPLLLDAATAQPLFDPAVYVATRLRGRAANTIHQHVVALGRLLRFCVEREIDLAQRVRTGRLLAPHELDALVAAVEAKRSERARVTTLDRRSGSRSIAANRLRAIRSYLFWLTTRRLQQLAHSGADYGRYEIARDRLIGELSARLPSVRISSDVQPGLSAAERERLLAAIDPNSTSNPWKRGATRLRNALVVRILYELGIRRGELLALRVEDFNSRESRISIVRRPDNPKDPRRRQPVVKTEERVLQLSPALAELLLNYVLSVRSQQVRGRHGFLIVETRSGAPLSASALDKIFAQLRSVKGLPNNLTSHALRHDWNDRFSASSDEKRIAPGEEMKLRKYLQGWKWDGSARLYNRRHTVKRANEALLAMQDTLIAGVENK